MDDAITVKYEINREQVGRMWSDVVRTRRWSLFSFLAIMPVITVVGAGDWRWQAVAWNIALGIGAAAVIFFPISLLMRWQFVRQFKKSPVWGVSRTWRITPERLHHEGGDGAMFRGDFAWAAVTRIVEGRDGFMMYTSTRIFQWLPYAGFGSEAQLGEFRALAAEKIPNFKPQISK